jgi:hypothetical protein
MNRLCSRYKSTINPLWIFFIRFRTHTDVCLLDLWRRRWKRKKRKKNTFNSFTNASVYYLSSEECAISDLRSRGWQGPSIHREILREVDLIGPSRLDFHGQRLVDTHDSEAHRSFTTPSLPSSLHTHSPHERKGWKGKRITLTLGFLGLWFPDRTTFDIFRMWDTEARRLGRFSLVVEKVLQLRNLCQTKGAVSLNLKTCSSQSASCSGEHRREEKRRNQRRS